MNYYAAGLRHQAHDHDEPHVSLVLAGGLEEQVQGKRVHAVGPGTFRIRPTGCRHAVTFSPRGALILVFPLDNGESTWPELRDLSDWHRIGRPEWRSMLPRQFLGTSQIDVSMAIAEIVAGALPLLHKDRKTPPWLARARERLLQDPATARIGDLATQAGVHRVYFARVFERRFGAPPSVYRRAAMLDCALQAVVAGQISIADAAYQAGFADQSHLARVAREFIGVAPTRLRALLHGPEGFIHSSDARPDT